MSMLCCPPLPGRHEPIGNEPEKSLGQLLKLMDSDGLGKSVFDIIALDSDADGLDSGLGQKPQVVLVNGTNEEWPDSVICVKVRLNFRIKGAACHDLD